MRQTRNRNQVITYSVNKGFNNRDLYIAVQNGEVVVKAPWYLNREQIQEVVEEKKQWILRKLKEYETSREQLEEIRETNVQIFGENCELVVHYKGIKTPNINIENKKIEMILPKKYKKVEKAELIKKLIEKMYDSIAEKEIERAMEKARITLGYAPEDYEIQKMNRVLGKCLPDKKIVINPEIVKYKKETIDYIVFHEYCHLKYKTHSKKFYQLIQTYMPNYEKHNERLNGWQY